MNAAAIRRAIPGLNVKVRRHYGRTEGARPRQLSGLLSEPRACCTHR